MLKWLWEMLSWLCRLNGDDAVNRWYEEWIKKDVKAYTEIQTYFNENQQQTERIDLSPKIDYARMLQRLRAAGLESSLSQDLSIKREIFGLEMRAREYSTELTEEDIATKFAKILNLAVNEELKPKIAETILNHAIYISETTEEILSSNMKIKKSSIELRNESSCRGISMQYQITYPDFTVQQVQKIADIYSHHYPYIEAKSNHNTLILEAHVLSEKVIPFIQNTKYRPAYIENPKTLQDLAADARLRMRGV